MNGSNISKFIKKHEKLRKNGLNLIASENFVSKGISDALSSDLAGRYHSDHYGGSKYVIKIIKETEELAKTLFDVRYAFIKPISGNICDLNVIFSFTDPGDHVAMVPIQNGGYPLGIEKFDRYRLDIPVKENSYDIDVEKMKVLYDNDMPELTLLGDSCIPFPYPLNTISELIPKKQPLVFDGAHVLGLIATGQFQDPLKEGVDILIGSTHKSFYGPQGGIILTNSKEYADKIRIYQDKEPGIGAGLVNNPHVNRIAALGIALEEILEDDQYGKKVVKNAKTLASSLDDLGVPMRFSNRGYTESHQIFLDMDTETSEKFCRKLEKENIFIDTSGRIGVAEVTHRGMDEHDMEKIAKKIAMIYQNFVN
ncbi:MAG: serine hydroxymethyltransferase [Candidatus Saliniplasma sp.]